MNTALFFRVWARPLTRMLLLSAALHLALIMAVQPRPFAVVDQSVVITVRLLEEVVQTMAAEALPEAPGTPTPAHRPPAEAATEPVPEPPVQASSPPTPEPAPAPPTPPEPVPMPMVAAAPPPVRAVPPEVSTAQPAQVATTAPDARSGVLPRVAAPAAGLLPSVPVMIDPTWYEARQLDVSPKTLLPIKPAYPLAAIRQGIQGTVKLKLRVDEYGEVREAEVVEADPPGVFEKSALTAFRQARFEAARRDRQPVRALIYIRVHYELND